MKANNCNLRGMETSEKMFHITQLGNRGGYIHEISAQFPDFFIYLYLAVIKGMCGKKP